jgi:hypothetical protein
VTHANRETTMNGTKAPAGGLVSVVNGQFYEGGQFTPDSGLYCGRAAVAVVAAAGVSGVLVAREVC